VRGRGRRYDESQQRSNVDLEICYEYLRLNIKRMKEQSGWNNHDTVILYSPDGEFTSILEIGSGVY
jgi:hypothetical protein